MIRKNGDWAILMKERGIRARVDAMKKKDYLVRAYSSNGEVRAFALNSLNLVKEAASIHSLNPIATIALGRALSASLLISETLKDEETLTLRFEGDGEMKEVIAIVDAKHECKGYVRNGSFAINENTCSVGKALGKGTLTIIRDMHMKEPYISSVPLYNGEIAEDLTHYFANSEQTATVLGLSVNLDKDANIKAAGGFFVQLMPNASENTISLLERNIKNIGSVGARLEEGKSVEDIIDMLFLGLEPVFMTEPVEVSYHCSCSKEHFDKVLIALGRKELREMMNDDKPVEIKCEFCGKTYSWSKEEVASLYYSLFPSNGKA